jgi:hypothetical protein
MYAFLGASAEGNDPKKYFQDFLKECPANEVRSVFFARKDIDCGQAIVIDLKNHVMWDDYGPPGDRFSNLCSAGPSQGGYGGQKLNPTACDTIASIVKTLPPPYPRVTFESGVTLAYQLNGMTFVRTYSRTKVLQEIDNIYLLAGAGSVWGEVSDLVDVTPPTKKAIY